MREHVLARRLRGALFTPLEDDLSAMCRADIPPTALTGVRRGRGAPLGVAWDALSVHIGRAFSAAHIHTFPRIQWLPPAYRIARTAIVHAVVETTRRSGGALALPRFYAPRAPWALFRRGGRNADPQCAASVRGVSAGRRIQPGLAKTSGRFNETSHRGVGGRYSCPGLAHHESVRGSAGLWAALPPHRGAALGHRSSFR